jgi:hypothetical protein
VIGSLAMLTGNLTMLTSAGKLNHQLAGLGHSYGTLMETG